MIMQLLNAHNTGSRRMTPARHHLDGASHLSRLVGATVFYPKLCGLIDVTIYIFIPIRLSGDKTLNVIPLDYEKNIS